MRRFGGPLAWRWRMSADAHGTAGRLDVFRTNLTLGIRRWNILPSTASRLIVPGYKAQLVNHMEDPYETLWRPAGEE